MIKIVLAAVLVTLSLAQNAQKADNIEYLSLGYNIYLGDPLAGSIDPGFCFSTIFNLTYINNDISFDGKYIEPDMVTVASESSCVLNSAASAVTSTSSYLNSVNAFASVDAGCPFGSFSASTTYKTVTQTTNDKSTYYTLSTGQCSVYVADITLDGFPQLTEAFLENAIKYLTNSESGMHYQFLSGYGTHYLKSVTMGSRLSVMDQLSAESWSSLQSQDISITAAAQASFMGAYVGFSAGASTSNTQVQAYDTSSSSFQEATIGSLPVGNANAAEWAQQAITNPMPIQYELAPISDLFNSQINSNLPTSIESATLDTILSNLNAALNGGYCQYLLSQGTVTSCSAVPDENNTPAPAVGSCVLCASGCGGLYSEPQAIFDVYQEQADWFMYYSPYCSQTTTLNIDGYSGGVDMCCIPETPGTLQGSCKMCTSCGGSFSYSEGSMWDGDQGLINLGWFQTYGDSCEGNLQADANPPAGYDLCCDQPGVCAFCATCGGEYAYETGVIANTDVSQPTAFGFYGPQCYGAWPGYGEEAGPNGFQLCCSHFSSS